MGWFSPDMQTMKDLFLHSMQDIYYAEHQIEKALPQMVEKASDTELKKGFRTHLKQTKGQIKRLDQAFKKLKVTPQGTKCPAIDGIIDEAQEIAGEIEDKMVLNAALIAAAQAVEHYEITRYGTLVAWAKLLGRNDVAKVLNMNLKEEKATDKKLNGIAKRKINRKAAARQRKRPDSIERAENSMLVAACGNPGGLTAVECVRQHFAHDVRQGFAGRIREPDPARTFRRPCRPRNPRDKHREFEREMCKDVTDNARNHDTTSRARQAARTAARGRNQNRTSIRCRELRSCRRAGLSPDGGARARSHRRAARRKRRRVVACLRASAPCEGMSLGRRAHSRRMHDSMDKERRLDAWANRWSHPDPSLPVRSRRNVWQAITMPPAA